MGMMRWTAPVARHTATRDDRRFDRLRFGQSTADLIARAPDSYRVEALVAGNSVEALAEQARAGSRPRWRWSPTRNAIARSRTRLLGTSIEGRGRPRGGDRGGVTAGRMGGWRRVVGYAGLAPTLVAARRGAMVALANKEGPGLRRPAADGCDRPVGRRAPTGRLGAQCDLPGCSSRATAAQSIAWILTASGGPFRNWSLADMAEATPRAGARPSQLGHGRQDLDRFGDHDEQGASS